MIGGLYIIRQNGSVEEREITGPPTGEELHEIVGGYIEIVPYWRRLVISKKKINSSCVAFCDENGKTTGNKTLNERATIMWERSLIEQGDSLRGRDHLVGDIVVVWGDRELLESL